MAKDTENKVEKIWQTSPTDIKHIVNTMENWFSVIQTDLWPLLELRVLQHNIQFKTTLTGL